MVNQNQWAELQNPVLKRMFKHGDANATHAPNNYSPATGEHALTIIEIPCPEQLQFDLVYRGTALQSCVTAGQTLQRADPLTHKQLQADNNGLLPGLLSPTDAVVESIEAIADGNITRVKLSVSSSATSDNHRPQQNSNQHLKNSHLNEIQPGALPWYCNKWKCFSAEQRWQALRESVIRGHGGGGFLLADKADSRINTVIINAVECEPLITCDAALIHNHVDDVLLGILCIVELTHCTDCTIAFESGREWQIELLQQAINDLRENHRTSHHQKQIHDLCGRLSLWSVPAIYPQGAERILFKTVTGKTLAEHELPGHYNACCINVATCHALYQLSSTGFPASERILTLTGDAMYESVWGAPVNIRASYGTPIATVLQAAGIETDTVRLQLGGPVCGIELDSSDYSIDAASNCIVISNSSAVEQTDNCIRCGLCADVCPVSLLPQQLHLAISSGNQKLADAFNLSSCIECGCCDLVCPSNIPLTRQFRQARKVAQLKERKTDNATLALQRYENRQSRLQRREAARAEQRKQRKQNVDNKALQKHEIAQALARARKKSGK